MVLIRVVGMVPSIYSTGMVGDNSYAMMIGWEFERVVEKMVQAFDVSLLEWGVQIIALHTKVLCLTYFYIVLYKYFRPY